VERTQFIDTKEAWWLNGDGLDFTALELRKDIATYLGGDRESQWYLEEPKLEELYRRLEEGPGELLRQVDEATDDLKRLAWLQAVADLLNPAKSETSKPGTGEPEGAAAKGPQPTTSGSPAPQGRLKPSAFGSARRGDAAVASASASGAASAAAASAPRKPSPFGSTKRAEADATPASASASGDIPDELEPVVDDLATAVAEAVAAVPGAEDLSPEELTQLVSEVLAGT
jgi:hypothetical protein